MPLSKDEYDHLIEKTVPVMHGVVRGFLVKHGTDAVPPEKDVWDWIYGGIRAASEDLPIYQRVLVASFCFRSIHQRIEVQRRGGFDALH